VPSRLVASATRKGGERVVEVQQWAELRREHFVAGKSIKRLVRETGLSKNTIRRALRSGVPPSYRRTPKVSVLEPFKSEIHRVLAEDPKFPAVRVRELLEPLGCTAGKTVVDDYLREVRPLVARPARTFQRTVYRPGEMCQFDV
jgi:transposase